MSLKNFLIEKELSDNYSERYMSYLSDYHDEVLLEIKTKLAKAWERDLKNLTKLYKTDSFLMSTATVKNSTSVDLVLVNHQEKLNLSRHSSIIHVAPSVKIPYTYQDSERNLIRKKLLSTSADVLKEVTNLWSEVFKLEVKGRLKSWFRILVEQDEIRFQLLLSINAHENYKTLYSVRVDYGKKDSKTRDFDRIYLVSLV